MISCSVLLGSDSDLAVGGTFSLLLGPALGTGLTTNHLAIHHSTTHPPLRVTAYSSGFGFIRRYYGLCVVRYTCSEGLTQITRISQIL
ncbi:MAG: hypothetical protein PWP64_1453 [Candidatus Cloacimonadota bacterium]|nr:hypothetical protein [Candidatus Cloacimonadota bacterium]